MASRIFFVAIIIFCSLIPGSLLGVRQPAPVEPANDAASDLQRKINRGELNLEFDATRGYLSSLLKSLQIPVSSQTLVFAKNSFQIHLISPAQPRAVYFNDDVYVGYVQGADIIEVTAVDPQLGPVFYSLEQKKEAKPKFERQTSQCLVCHDSSLTADPIPRLLVLSVLPDPNGTALKATSLLTTDRSPLRERWGGWYVTGTHGAQRHLGNTIVRSTANAIGDIKEYVAGMNLEAGANVTDLRLRFDTKPYLTPHSDLVALMILAHQTHVHNLMTLATYKLKNPDGTGSSADEVAEQLVRSMLFVEAAPLTEPVAGTTNFADDFMKRGPIDSQGRSLRQMDLKKRLLRYPLSYLIYSRQFDEMPARIRQYTYRRIREVLEGKENGPEFAHLSEPDRKAILEILLETKPEFAALK
jgi:hypothetical protein